MNNVWDLDGCPDEPRDFYVAVKDNVEVWWQGIFSTVPTVSYSPITTFTAYGLFPLNTPCGQSVGWNAFYCPVNAGVYYHSSFLDAFLGEVGDMAPAFIVSHEIGHHVSWLLDWIPGVTMSTKQNELQADCFAGAWAAGASNAGLLEVGDLEEAVIALVLVGDPDQTWFDPTLHGTPTQRVFAFDSGFDSGPGKCTDPDWLSQFPTPPAEAPSEVLGKGSVQLDP